MFLPDHRIGRLLITDDPDDEGRALFADVLVLGVSTMPPAPAAAIVCHVALRDPATRDALEAALAICRPRPGPSAGAELIVVLRDDDVLGFALANGLGATRILAADRLAADPAGFRWTARLGLDAAPSAFAALPEAVKEAVTEAAPGHAGPDMSAHPAAKDAAAKDAATPDTAAEDAVAEQAATAATVLAGLFASAARRAPLAMAEVEQGATAVLRGARDDIRLWVEVVRRYDDATYQHCLLVAGFCAALAERIGFSGVRQHLIVQAALLHDIGKARVPVALLNKPGALTTAETAVVRRHPTDGYYMLAGQGDIPAIIRDVVLHHHELLDGSGYPHGLRAAQIPEEVRLSTVCDVYAALVERRPYRDPMTPQAAFAILVAMGNKLDAMLVAALGGLLETSRTGGLAAAS